jgi:hypothetical protein
MQLSDNTSINQIREQTTYDLIWSVTKCSKLNTPVEITQKHLVLFNINNNIIQFKYNGQYSVYFSTLNNYLELSIMNSKVKNKPAKNSTGIVHFNVPIDGNELFFTVSPINSEYSNITTWGEIVIIL